MIFATIQFKIPLKVKKNSKPSENPEIATCTNSHLQFILISFA